MKDALRTILVLVVLAVIGAIGAPGVLFGMRLAETWTHSNTDQLLGGLLAICGGSMVLVALMIGAGAFARLAGWRPPRQEDPPQVIDVTPRPELPTPPLTPPWGLTGGGHYELLPPPQQDRRYRMEVRTGKEAHEGK